MSRTEIMGLLSLRDKKYFVQKYLNPAIDEGYIELTIPDKPTSRNQKYRKVNLGD